MVKMKLIKTLYKRNMKKNRLMIIFMFLTNLLMGTFVLFLDADQAIIPRLSTTYLEHLSVGISSFETLSTNNELMNVRMHRRPPLALLSSMMTHIGSFEIRPDYTLLFDHAKLSMYEKSIEKPYFAIHGLKTNQIGINQSFYETIKKAVQPDLDFTLKLSIFLTITIEEIDVDIDIKEHLPITFIKEEPPFFLRPKLYLPQSFIDEKIGSYSLKTRSTINDYLLNVPHDHPASGYRYLCHLESNDQKARLTKLLNDISHEKEGYELISDAISKVESIKTMFTYLNLLVSIFLVLIMIGCVVVYITIVHTSFLSSMKQMALLSIWGAKKTHLFLLFLGLVIFNYLLGGCAFFLFPTLMQTLNRFLSLFLHLPLFLAVNPARLLLLASGQLFILVSLYTIVFLGNNQRPLLYLLLDA